MQIKDEEVVAAIQSIEKAISKSKSLEDRILALEKKCDEYSALISKTSGFCTRLGFYADAIILYFRGKAKK